MEKKKSLTTKEIFCGIPYLREYFRKLDYRIKHTAEAEVLSLVNGIRARLRRGFSALFHSSAWTYAQYACFLLIKNCSKNSYAFRVLGRRIYGEQILVEKRRLVQFISTY